MSTLFFLSLFLGLGVLYLALGIFTSRGIKSTQDYFLAGRNLGLISLTFTLVATQIGGGMLLGTANDAYLFGYYGGFYTLGMCAGFIMLGLGLASKLRQFNVATTAELFEVKYGSPFLRKIASIVSALSMIGLFAGQVIASRNLFSALGITGEASLLLFWAFVLAYTITGGLKAVVLTDVFQVIFLISIIAGAFAYSLCGESLAFFSLNSIVTRQSLFSGSSIALLAQIPILISAALYPLFGQDLAQRFFSAKNKKIAVVSAMLASFILIIFSYIPVYFGMKAKLLGLVVPAGKSVFLSVLGTLSGDFVLALVGCALIAAITSTADSLLCAISSNLTQDFNYSFVSEKQNLFVSKIVTCVAGIIGMFIAYFSQNILGVLSQSYWLLISCLFASVFFCFFTDKLKKQAAIVSILAGALSFVLLLLVPLNFSSTLIQVARFVVPLVFSFVGYGLGYIFVKSEYVKS